MTGTGRYIRMYGTARATAYGYSLWEFQVFTTGTSGGGGGTTPHRLHRVSPTTPNFGPNVDIFDPSMSASSIQSTLDSVFNTQKLNQFGTQRYALLFKPGTYSAEANIGYYTSIQGLGQNPDDVTINGDVTVDAFDGTGNATQNFWRSAENMAINPSSGSDRWAVAQAGPFRRMDVHGGLELYPASYGYASGGYIADSKVSGQVSSRVAAAVVLPGQQLRELERLGVEHGVLRRDRGARAELPQPADDHAGHHPDVTGRSVPVRRLRG